MLQLVWVKFIIKIRRHSVIISHWKPFNEIEIDQSDESNWEQDWNAWSINHWDSYNQIDWRVLVMDLVNWTCVELVVERNGFTLCPFRIWNREESSLIPSSFNILYAYTHAYLNNGKIHGENQTPDDHWTYILEPRFVEIWILSIKPATRSFNISTLQHYQNSCIENWHHRYSYFCVLRLLSFCWKSDNIYEENN